MIKITYSTYVNNVYVGPDCESLLENLSLECAQEIKFKCLDFYITAVQVMLKRLPCKDTFFKQLTFLDPQIYIMKVEQKLET